MSPGALRALLLAPPGAGKGTQGTRLAAAYRVSHLATGDLLRAEVEAGSALGVAAGGFMERGDLVPDELVVELVRELVDGDDPLDGFVLDGFPRTIDQALEAYEWGREKDRTFHAVVHLEVPTAELVRRLVTRGLDSGRVDDDEDTIVERLRVYAEKTAPLLDFYRGRGILLPVDGTGGIDEVFDRILGALEGIGVPPPP